MNDQHSCPLCTEVYDDRTTLRVHLEVEHRKSEIVAAFVDQYDDGERSVDDAPRTDAERSVPSAD